MKVDRLLLTSSVPRCATCGGHGYIPDDAEVTQDVWATTIQAAYAERVGRPLDHEAPPLFLTVLLDAAAEATFPHADRADQRAAVVQRLEEIQADLAAIVHAVHAVP